MGGTAWPGLRAHVENKRLDLIVGDCTEGVTIEAEAQEAWSGRCRPDAGLVCNLG
jgi:hypothetical protein